MAVSRGAWGASVEGAARELLTPDPESGGRYRAKNAPTNFTQYVEPIGSSASLKS